MVVQIGPGGGQILSISPKGIEFIDETGKEHFIDLTKSYSIAKRTTSDYIGWRKLDEPPWWVEIRKVRFVFPSYEAAYEELLDSMMEHGWTTMDIT